MITMTWNVFGVYGKKRKDNFPSPCKYNFSDDETTRIIEITGDNTGAIVRITSNTLKECQKEFWRQLSDGAFSNSRVGKVILIEERS